MKNNTISVSIPLTNASGKIRIKERSILNEYGTPIATRQKPFNQKCYVEWQIGYDVKVSDIEKAKQAKFTNRTFIGANGLKKYLYELSEYIKQFFDWGIITKDELIYIKNYINSIEENSLFEYNSDLSIKRSQMVEKNINGFNCLYSKVEYPLVIYKFENFEIVAEIETKEKQYAVGVQPMLYFCFPITELEHSESLLGRTANTKECGTFIFDESKKNVLLQMLQIFGILSKSHKHDTLSIIDLILNYDNEEVDTDE